ncbi:hypothetical protein [Devosia nitrariae]|uniref:Uncharacterized protein n=1 Tax=Devosia nitrariae TaxID=2071872 RepID=A0ABQ5W276_9HYPH|nr:hypothetical protein [Devosia nitrariae]GLQ53806.1 hypothetical protein GCM10010862_10650 [Devosia nitrariae]
MTARRLLRLLLLAALTLAVAVQPALGERVFVRAASGEEGHAWLFGSQRQDAQSCWLAFPRHVAADTFSGALAAFTFETVNGNGGESGTPIAVGAHPEALAAMGEIEDMAFAPVVAGPRPGACLSRLGPPPFAYPTMMRSASKLTMFSLLPNSFGIFEVAVSRARADAAGGGLLMLRPVNADDARAYLVKGLSGAVAELERPEGMVPVAMVIEVGGEPLMARAVRFDLIRAAFEVIEARGLEDQREARAAATGVPYEILDVEGVTLAAGTGPVSLVDGQDCWTAAPAGGQRAVRVTVALTDSQDATRGLSMVQSADCGTAGARVIIEQRPNASSGWTVARDCQTVSSAGEAPACALDLRAPRHIRISIEAGGAIGLSQLRLY